MTGGAGFLGSHLTEKLTSMDLEVVVLDNLSSGSVHNLANVLDSGRNSGHCHLVIGDCNSPVDVTNALRNADVIFHLSANSEVRIEKNDGNSCFRQNILATHTLLEALKNSTARVIVFASTSTVYGEAMILPTPEDYSPLEPISLYGGSKLASESLISSYCHAYGKKAVILRLANVVGERSKRGVVYDFVAKLRKNPKQLEIFGDGRQRKSYVHVSDCVDAIVRSQEVSEKPVEIFNVGSQDCSEVNRIAELVAEQMGKNDVTFKYFPGQDGRGWDGDVRNMQLDISKLKSRGWRPKYSSEEAITLAVRSYLEQAPELIVTRD